ncbi:MAG: VWA domain-containing protein [Bryobacteraceae bacterium]
MTRTCGARNSLQTAFLLALLFRVSGALAQAPPVGPQPQEDFRIAVNVDLVVLNATVSDRKGHIVSDLGEKDFQVFEDGVRQNIRLFRHDDIPVTVGLVVDHSGSMRAKIRSVIAAAGTFVRSSNPDDQMFVVNFNEKVTLRPSGRVRFTVRADELEYAISSEPVTGRTALYDAIFQARERLREGSRDKKVLIVISDGGDNASNHRLEEVLKLAVQSGAIVYTIGIFEDDDPDKNPNVLRQIAQATGGEAFFPREFEEVVPICERIAHDIRNQYTLGYFSSSTAAPGTVHTIRAVAQKPGGRALAVRTRTSYIASDPAPNRDEARK